MTKTLSIDDSGFVIMTKDKKCILKGRKNTNFMLFTLHEKAHKKLYICRHKSDVVRRLNSEFGTIWISDEVKKLYGVDGNVYFGSGLPELIAERVHMRYEIDI